MKSHPLILPVLKSVFLLFFASCAVRQAPPGGPEDKTPPNIVRVEPPAGSTGVSPKTGFSITFSKTMDQERTQNAVFLSPVFWAYPTFKWSDRTLVITPPEKLRPSTTYILTIGAGAVDSHGNKLGKSYGFAFSTGATIDSGSISGAIFSEEREKIVFDIWAYTLTDSASPDLWTRIPDYATQVDSSGGFTIGSLGNGQYLVIAVDDKNDDLFWDPSSEAMGLPPFLVRITQEQRYKGVILRPARRDTTLAYVSKVTPVDRQKLAVEFSQPPRKAQMLSSDSYKIEHSDSDSTLRVLGIYLGEGERLMLETSEQTDGESYRLIPLGMLTIWGVPFDTAGAKFTGVGAPDTIGPKLLSAFPADGSRDVYQDSVVELTFSERIKTLHLTEAMSVVADSTDTLRYLPALISPNTLRLRFVGRLPREKRVAVAFRPHSIIDAFDIPMSDSSLSFSFRLPPADTVGTVTADVGNIDIGPIIATITQIGAQNVSYQSLPAKTGKISMEFVYPGSYRFEFFEDSDGNGEWSPGVASPFKPSERFSFLPDTLKVRSRWSTDVGVVFLPEPEQ